MNEARLQSKGTRRQHRVGPRALAPLCAGRRGLFLKGPSPPHAHYARHAAYRIMEDTINA